MVARDDASLMRLRDIGEGSWLTEEGARAFADAEVGEPWYLVLDHLGNWIICVPFEEDTDHA
jgi:hypothetical protein